MKLRIEVFLIERKRVFVLFVKRKWMVFYLSICIYLCSDLCSFFSSSSSSQQQNFPLMIPLEDIKIKKMGKKEKKRDRSRDRKSKDKRHKKDKKHYRRSSSSSSSSQTSVDYDAMIMSTSAPVLSRDAMNDDPLPSETAGIAKLPPGASLEAHVAENHMTEQLMKKFFPRTVPEIEREARRLYVSNLSPDATDRQLQDFFDKKLRPLRARQGHVYPLSTPVCVGVEMSIPQEGKKPFCFVELVDEDTATTAIEQLAGVQFVS